MSRKIILNKENQAGVKKKSITDMLSHENVDMRDDIARRAYNAESLGIPLEENPDLDGDNDEDCD